ncbi:MAG: tyrosine-type recombinase/integrase [Candidatus Poribacteria bacterium]|nr:tyrosine-type recombinase/integrase [Candidatus Poribacteria bacterium]
MGRRRKKDKHLPERLYIRYGTYYFVEYGTNRWINIGRDYVQAMSAYADRTSEDTACLTMSDLIDRYLREVAPKKAARTYQDNVKQARFLRAYFGQMRLRDITQPHIYKYKDERGKRSEVQTNRELALLSHMFGYAVRWGDLHHSDNPCVRIQRFKEQPRDRYVEDWEFYAFKDHAGPLIAAYMEFEYLTGLRQGDILAIRRDQLKEDGVHITIRKTGKKIVIQWSDDLRAAVDAVGQLKRPVRGLYLFCTRKGQPYTSNGFRSIWQRKMRSALETGILNDRFQSRDIRAKTGSDTDYQHAVELLAHEDGRITKRHYRRKPEKVRPLR